MSTSAERMKKKRAADKAHLKNMDAKPLNMIVYKSTRKQLDELKLTHEFEEDAEIITLLIHNLSKSSHVTQHELLALPESK